MSFEERTTRPPDPEPAREEDIPALVARLGRPHSSGGTVIERAALLAAGADFAGAMEWILAHGGEPEFSDRKAPRRGLYGSASEGSGVTGSDTPLRFVLPAGALR